jgi:hypothetical protein
VDRHSTKTPKVSMVELDPLPPRLLVYQYNGMLISLSCDLVQQERQLPSEGLSRQWYPPHWTFHHVGLMPSADLVLRRILLTIQGLPNRSENKLSICLARNVCSRLGRTGLVDDESDFILLVVLML